MHKKSGGNAARQYRCLVVEVVMGFIRSHEIYSNDFEQIHHVMDANSQIAYHRCLNQ